MLQHLNRVFNGRLKRYFVFKDVEQIKTVNEQISRASAELECLLSDNVDGLLIIEKTEKIKSAKYTLECEMSRYNNELNICKEINEMLTHLVNNLKRTKIEFLGE